MTRVALLLLALSVCAQTSNDLLVEKIASGFTFLEGPAWSHENYLIFSDIPRNKLYKLIFGRPLSELREASNGSVGNTFDRQGRLYTCESHTRRVVRQDNKGEIEVLAATYQGKRLNAPNSVVVRADGEIYFTDPAFGFQQDSRELDFYGVFHISRKGGLEVVAKPKGRPNGITLSPNGRILYVTNSDEKNVRAYDLDKAGQASNERTVVSGIDGVPNGICTDEAGNLYVAANDLLVYTPEGRKLTQITLGVKPSNCAFGDPDLQSLYITARGALFRVRLNVKGSLQY